METVKRKFGAHNVSTAPEKSPEKFILTGLSGVGKTYFLSTIPKLFFLAIEEGLKGVCMDSIPAHFQDEHGRCIAPQTYEELVEALRVFRDEINAPDQTTRRRPYAHLGLDSFTGIERLVHKKACNKERVDHMEGKEFGALWRAAIPLWDALRSQLDDIRKTGVHLWLIAHSVETENSNNEGEIFKRWDLLFSGSQRMANEIRQFWRGWADHVFFIDWTTTVTKRAKGKVSMGRFGGRVLCTKETARYYAKHRGRLPDTIPATWPDLAKALTASRSVVGSATEQAKFTAQIEAIIPQISPENAAEIRKDLKTASGASALSAVLSRAQGMLAVATEETEDGGGAPVTNDEPSVPQEAEEEQRHTSEPPPSDERVAESATPVVVFADDPAVIGLRACETPDAIDVMLGGMLEMASTDEERQTLVCVGLERHIDLAKSVAELKSGVIARITEHRNAGRLPPAIESARIKPLFKAKADALAASQAAA